MDAPRPYIFCSYNEIYCPPSICGFLSLTQLRRCILWHATSVCNATVDILSYNPFKIYFVHAQSCSPWSLTNKTLTTRRKVSKSHQR